MNTDQLFNLVAPIAICCKADLEFEKKAKAAWRTIRKMNPSTWTSNGCPKPPEVEWDELDQISYEFAQDAYAVLFESIVESRGNSELVKGYDYWGARGYRLPHQHSKNFELVGSSSDFYPWYETAELLVERLNEIQKGIDERDD